MFTFSFNHLALSVQDVDISAVFYQKVFQIDEIKNTASNSKTRWFSIGEGKQLHLIPRPNAEIKTNKAIHFALATPNINAFIKQLDRLKIEYSDWRDTPDKNYVRDDGIKQIYFQDPDGYWVEINETV